MLSQNWLQSRRTVWLLIVLLLVSLLYNLGGWGVLETSEARYAEISREMLVSGNWMHPRLLGILHYHKPPVTYIISAAGMALFGVNEFGVRFFLQLSFLLQALLVYELGWLLFKNRSIAITALVMYVTIPAVLISARNLTTDSFLATFELLAIWAWLKYKLQRNHIWLYLFCTLLALAFLTKGPVGLIFPVLVMLGFKGKNVVSKTINWYHFLAAILLFLLLSASWYLYLMVQDRQFADYFILNHTVNRFANPETFHRSKPWWFYLLLTPLLSLPWSAVLLLYFTKLKNLLTEQKRLFLLWLVFPLVFFSLSSSKLILYILPLFAGLALLTAWLLHQLPRFQLAKVTTIAYVYFGLVTIGLFVASKFLHITLLPAMYIFLLIILAALYLIWHKIGHFLSKLLIAAFAFILLLIPLSAQVLESNPAEFNATRQIAKVLQAEGLQQHHIVVYDKLLPSLAFELKHNFVSIHDQSRSLERETQFEKDDRWRESYLQLNKSEDSTALVKLLEQKSVVLVKGELPGKRHWIVKSFTKRKRVGKWQLYY